MRLPQSCRGLFARILSIALALSVIVSLCSVHSALAHAEIGSTGTVTMSMPDADHPEDAPGLAQCAHLAGHLTCVIAPVSLVGLAQDAVLAPAHLLADHFPHSLALPTPSEPPRA